MENFEEHWRRVDGFHGSIHSLSGVLEKISLPSLSLTVSSRKFTPKGTANLQSSINAKDSLGS